MKQLLLAGTAFLAIVGSHRAAYADPIVFDFPYTGSLVPFTVPTTDTYQILAFGGQGGDVITQQIPPCPCPPPPPQISPGGHGAEIGGNFSLAAGETLQIAVGGAGSGTNVTAPVFTLTLTQTSIFTTGGALAIPPVQILVLGPQPPAVSGSAYYTAGVLGLSLVQPIPSVGGGTGASPTVIGMSLNNLVPVVTAGVGLTFATQALILTVPDPIAVGPPYFDPDEVFHSQDGCVARIWRSEDATVWRIFRQPDGTASRVWHEVT